jgi:hypothetical protein
MGHRPKQAVLAIVPERVVQLGYLIFRRVAIDYQRKRSCGETRSDTYRGAIDPYV